MNNEELLAKIEEVGSAVHTEYRSHRDANGIVEHVSHMFRAETMEDAESIAIEARAWILHGCRRASHPVSVVINWLPTVTEVGNGNGYVVDYMLDVVEGVAHDTALNDAHVVTAQS